MKMEGEAGDRVEGNGSSRNPEIEQTEILAVIKDSSDETESKTERIDGDKDLKEENKSSGDYSIDIKGDVTGRSRNSITVNAKEEKVCRICHFGTDQSFSGGSELIALGCNCKGELGWSHPHCAEVWFTHKGNRLCEICGKMAINIDNNTEETSIFLMEWNEMRLVAATLDDSQESSRRCKQFFCKFLLVCLILAFLLTWFFKGIKIL